MPVDVDAATIDGRLAAFFRETWADRPSCAPRLTLEIQRGGDLLERRDILDILRDFRAAGARLALDDVGSLYSSLLCLKDLPIDEIKLDPGFVRTLEEQPEGIAFTGAMCDLARSLGVDIVAEGVETEDIRDAVSVLDVPLLQGYALAMPMAFAKLAGFLDRPRRPEGLRPASLFGVYARHMEYDQGMRRYAPSGAVLVAPPRS